MLSKELLDELDQILNSEFALQLSKQELFELGEKLLGFYSTLREIKTKEIETRNTKN